LRYRKSKAKANKMAIITERIEFKQSASIYSDDLQTETVYQSVTGHVHTPSDVTTAEQMCAVEASGTLSFWDAPEEDKYSGNDGDAV
jgi:hypothetical protein